MVRIKRKPKLVALLHFLIVFLPPPPQFLQHMRVLVRVYVDSALQWRRRCAWYLRLAP